MKEYRVLLGSRHYTLKTQFREARGEYRPGSLLTGPCPLIELSVCLRFCWNVLLRKPRPVIKGRGSVC